MFVGFDVGETLIRYDGLALDWSEHYCPALRHALATPALDDERLAVALDILAFYNTRRHPRVFEIAAGEVTEKLARIYEVDAESFERAFFGYFQRRASPMPGAEVTLARLRQAGAYLVALSDVPYGMPTTLLEEDLGALVPALDQIASSCDIGVRKPHQGGLRRLLEASGRGKERAFYVGNEPKDIAVARAAGVRSILLSDDPTPPDHGQTFTICALSEIPELVAH